MRSRFGVALAVLVAEIAVFIVAARQVNIFWLFVVVFVFSVVGVWALAKRVPELVGASFADLGSSLTDPSLAKDSKRQKRDLGDRALQVAAGLLLVFPGLLTGIFGLALFIKPIRVLLSPIVGKRIVGFIPEDLRTGGVGSLFRTAFGVPGGFGGKGSSPFGGPRRGDFVDANSTTKDSSEGSGSKPARPELN